MRKGKKKGKEEKRRKKEVRSLTILIAFPLSFGISPLIPGLMQQLSMLNFFK